MPHSIPDEIVARVKALPEIDLTDRERVLNDELANEEDMILLCGTNIYYATGLGDGTFETGCVGSTSELKLYLSEADTGLYAEDLQELISYMRGKFWVIAVLKGRPESCDRTQHWLKNHPYIQQALAYKISQL